MLEESDGDDGRPSQVSPLLAPASNMYKTQFENITQVMPNKVEKQAPTLKMDDSKKAKLKNWWGTRTFQVTVGIRIQSSWERYQVTRSWSNKDFNYLYEWQPCELIQYSFYDHLTQKKTYKSSNARHLARSFKGATHFIPYDSKANSFIQKYLSST